MSFVIASDPLCASFFRDMIKLLNNCIYFDIVVRALRHSFKELGIDHSVVSTVDDNDMESTYVVFTTHHTHERLPHRYISYNFEQLVTDKQWPAEFFERLAGASQVWDYSLRNIEVLCDHGIKAVHLPFGYSPCMDSVPVPRVPWQTRAHDWLMLGCMGPLRIAKLQGLLDSYASGGMRDKARVDNNCWGDRLSDAYAAAKVGLNVHFYPGRTILEVHRIVPMVANRVWVVSETSDDAWYDDAYKSIVTFVKPSPDASTLSRKIKAAVDITCALKPEFVEAELDKRRQHLVQNCSYTNYIRQAMACPGDQALRIPGFVVSSNK